LLTGFGVSSCIAKEAFLSSAFHVDMERKREKRLPIKVKEQSVEYYFVPENNNTTNNVNNN
jgi:hypothetical protein